MNATHPVVFAIDEQPLSLSTACLPDYIGRMIGGALREPLFRCRDSHEPEFEASSCATWHVHESGLAHEFCLNTQCRWSNSEPITSADYLRTFERAIKKPFWRRQFRNFNRISIRSPTILRIELTRRMGHLPALLAVPELAPTPPTGENPATTNGPYYYEDGNYRHACILRRNPYFPNSTGPETILFQVIRGPREGLEAFASGEVDVTCPTAFPFEALDEYDTHAAFRRSETGITMQLEFNATQNEVLAKRGIRLGLSLAIDRREISQGLYRGVIPANSFGTQCFGPGVESACTRFAPEEALVAYERERPVSGSEQPLRLAFNDYYPNRIIAERVRFYWEKVLGVKTELVDVPFQDDSASNYDIKLALRFPTFPHPIGDLENYVPLLMLTGEELGARRLLREIDDLGSCDPSDQAGMRRAVWATIDSLVPTVPLFHIIGHHLQHPKLVGFDYPVHARFDFTHMTR